MQWISEAYYYCPGTSCILVGLNAHLRTDPATLKHLKTKGITPITAPQATELAKRVKAIKYIEYAQHESGAAPFFEDAIRSIVFPTTRQQKVHSSPWMSFQAWSNIPPVITGNEQTRTNGGEGENGGGVGHGGE